MWDITFCSDKKCKNLECDRNQNNYNFTLAGNKPISIANFSKCEYYTKEEKDEIIGTVRRAK